jgi:hypothetical protein
MRILSDLSVFSLVSPQLKLRAILIRRPATAPQIPKRFRHEFHESTRIQFVKIRAIRVKHSVPAPQEHPKIARSFNCGSTPPKKQSPAGATDKTVAENSAAPPGLADFYRIKPAVETAGYSLPSLRDFAP